MTLDGMKMAKICRNILPEEMSVDNLTFVRPCVIGTAMCATDKLQQIPFIDLFVDVYEFAVHVSGDKLAHLQEHFLTVYTAFATMHRYCC